MDGTIIDSMPVWKHAGSRYVRSLGITPEPELDDKIFHMNITQFIDYIKNTYSIDTPSETVFNDVNAQIVEQYRYVTAKPGAPELLSALKSEGFILSLATASSEEIAKPVLSRLSVWELFDSKFCNISKSKPDIFYEISANLGVKPCECCVVEDTAHSAESAKAAGMKILGVFDEITEYYQGSMEKISDLYYLTLNNTESILNDIKEL